MEAARGAARPAVLCLIDTVGAGGGAEQLIATLAPAMRARGVDLEVVALYDWPDDLGEAMVAAGVPLHRLHARPGAPLRTAWRLRQMLRRRRYDVFWGHLFWGNAFARVAQWHTPGSRSVVTLHSEGYADAAPQGTRDRIAVAVEGRLLGGADARVAVSGAVVADWSRHFGWRDIAVAHNGVEVVQARRRAAATDSRSARAAIRCDERDFLVVTPARYVAKKGQIYLLDAATRLVNEGVPLRLFLCGTGPLAGELRDAARARGLADRVMVSPVVPQEQLFPVIAAADVFCLPSLREPFGIAAAEAMAIGTPTVLTAVDGFRELVGESGGAVLVPPADAATLADALLAIRADPAAASQMAEAGSRHVADHFSIEACAARWDAILTAVHRGESASCAASSA